MTPVPGEDAGDGDGHMLSFNHYAYGAVVDWIYRTVAGLAPDITSPGYRRVILAPRPDGSITFCTASLDAPQGLVSTSWRVEGESFSAVVDLPFGTTGLFDAPCGPSSVVVVDGQRLEGEVRHSAVLAPGHHTIEVTNPVLVSKVAPLRSMA
jgi:alpha-L-rhamnosidase